MDILIKVTQFFLSLSVLIIIHECGHFFTARLFKIRVEKFYLFFDPWFSLFKFKYKDTEYGIGWVPLGGYVKIAGMIDESMDKEQMKQPPQPWEFRTKPAWQRLIVMVAGVFMNILLAIGIYILLLFFIGETYLPTKNVKYGVVVDSLAYNIGLRNGDKILTVDNKYIENFKDIPLEVVFNESKTLQVQRDSAKLNIAIPEGFISNLLKTKNLSFIDYRFPFVIEDFAPTSAAKDAGMLKGDRIIAINDKSTLFYDEFKEELQKHRNDEITITVIRKEKEVKIPLKVPQTALIGVAVKDPTNFLDFKQKEYSFFQAIPAGTKKTYKTTVDYIKQFKLLFTSKEVKVSDNLGGFISIGKIFSPQWDWVHFWSITAFLSIILAFMNILPIPALDGGHVIFIFYEIITRRKPNEKFLEYAQYTGLIILLGLVLFANINDVLRLFK